ncbi:MAG: hypothetical protein ACOC9Y_03120 [Chloroflexota bacterium]
MTITAPWTTSQVAALWDRQNDQTKHPYTCGERGCDQALIPFEDGWHCPEHGLVQRWAHAEDCQKKERVR